MSYEVVYTSCNGNQTPGAADWGNNNLICFGNSHAVRIYDPSYGSGGKIITTLYGHSSYVNTTRWITGKPYETELISGSDDGKLIVWSNNEKHYVPSVIAECKALILMADGCYKNPNTEHSVFVASVSDTATANTFLNIYERLSIGGEITTVQNINIGKHVAMALKLTLIPVTDTMVIGLGTDTGYFMLYAENPCGTFHKCIEIKAHTQWIRGLDFTSVDSDVLFATSSHDKQVKVWRMKVFENSHADDKSVHNDLMCKNVELKINDVKFSITLDTILQGHNDWVFTVYFNRPHLELLSASMDKTIIIWHKPEGSPVWVEKDRFGEIGITNVGFIGGMFGPKGEIFARGVRSGTFHLWSYCNKERRWKPAVTLGGHADKVVDLAWEPNGQFLYSTSHDRTTRIHAPWTANGQHTTWHEIARPQIHGHDMSCLALLSRYEYAVGAEEKVIRTFKAPRNFIENFRRICKVSDNEIENDEGNGNIPQGAAISSLGLTNKAVYDGQNAAEKTPWVNDDQNLETETNFIPLVLFEPPTEQDLLQNTLWPETHKLYGHGNELFSMAATHDGVILASACKATSRELACILLWDTTTWIQVDKLKCHCLTVCRLAFSPDSKHLLSVSRDRRWTLFTKDNTTGKYILSAVTDSQTQIHTRIIWDCAWLPNSLYFVTGSRDGKVIIWKNNSDQNDVVLPHGSAGQFLDLKGESVTAVTVAPIYVNSLVLIAIGLECGVIHLYMWNEYDEDNLWKLFVTINNRDAHHKAVRRLAFRKNVGRAGIDDNKNIIQLASCGSDGAVIVFDINL